VGRADLSGANEVEVRVLNTSVRSYDLPKGTALAELQTVPVQSEWKRDENLLESPDFHQFDGVKAVRATSASPRTEENTFKFHPTCPEIPKPMSIGMKGTQEERSEIANLVYDRRAAFSLKGEIGHITNF